MPFEEMEFRAPFASPLHREKYKQQVMQTSQFVSGKGLPSPLIPILNSLAQTDSNSVKSENPVHKPADPGSMKRRAG